MELLVISTPPDPHGAARCRCGTPGMESGPAGKEFELNFQPYGANVDGVFWIGIAFR